jgi:hypothetical protein
VIVDLQKHKQPKTFPDFSSISSRNAIWPAVRNRVWRVSVTFPRFVTPGLPLCRRQRLQPFGRDYGQIVERGAQRLADPLGLPGPTVQQVAEEGRAGE